MEKNVSILFEGLRRAESLCLRTQIGDALFSSIKLATGQYGTNMFFLLLVYVILDI